MKLILLCGKANSGKTTLRNFLEESLHIQGMSANDYIKSYGNYIIGDEIYSHKEETYQSVLNVIQKFLQ